MKKFSAKAYIAAAVLICLAGKAPALDDKVSVNPQVKYQVFEGFGQGGMDQFIPYWYTAWSSSVRTTYLDRMYTLNNSGLGLEISRILMPVGDAPSHYHHDRFGNQGNRAPESFEPEDGTFVWTGHERILWHIQGAASRGAKMWSSWYSMPYWMTVSGCTSGHTSGSQNNLQAGKEGRFAQHICQVMKHFKDNWNVNFTYVGAINEPDENWWVYWGGQPGCRTTSSQAITIYQQIKAAMPTYGLNVQMVAPDSFSINNDYNLSYLDAMLASSIGPDLAALCGHQYYTTDEGYTRWNWRAVKNGRGLWQTEWGDWTNGGYPDNKPYEQAINYLNKIHDALKKMRVTAWIMWEPKFLLNDTGSNFTLRKSYWAVAQYSRFVRSGMQQLDSSDSVSGCNTTVWLDPADGPSGRKVSFVTVNGSGGVVTLSYDFSPFGGAAVSEVRRTSETQDFYGVPVSQASPYSYSVSAPNGSVVSISAVIPRCPVMSGEFTGDCFVGIEDMRVLASNWLNSVPAPCTAIPGDTNADCSVNLLDFGNLSNQWESFKAFNPTPADGQAASSSLVRMSWAGNLYAVSHDVYLGTSRADAANAGRTSAQYMGNVAENVYYAHLTPSQVYYWRIDQIDAGGAVQKGDVWSFTTGASTADPDLVGWWKLNEASGTVAYDAGGYGNNGTLRGNPVWQPTGGKVGGAIDLDGVGDAVEISSGFNLSTNTITMTAWIKGWKAADWAGIVYSRINGQACGMDFGANNTLHYTWNYDDISTYGWDGGPVIPNNEWALVALVVEPGKATLYVYSAAGGLQQASNVHPHIVQTLNNLKLGWDSQYSMRYFDGLMDDVRVYKRAMGQNEILWLTQ